ncbi:cation:proton antiporter [Spirosoma validum]|uniref:Sodium:proton antiporter n=1 Tax=Spirosoma validum TaxID=2771355 RepID=A0A927B559_9BACT|nr:sodium:proton antiporter [Spirosoma validum]MBD2755493.1 sodium:proton antiporter [Spirosoma validum]
MELYYSFSVLIVLTAVFAYVNERFLKLPSTIGIMLMAMLVSIALVVTGNLFPNQFDFDGFSRFIANLDFTEILMGAMLNFLLFAGAIHVRLKDLREQRAPIIVFSTISVMISTFIVGFLIYYLLPLFRLNVPLIQCLVFGALISPTDPIAVLGILKKAGVRKSLETKVAGESLFNDGVAVVVFAVLLQLAQGSDVDVSFSNISWLLIKEAVGGFGMGVLIGFIGSRAMQRIDNPNVSALITLAIVMGGYLIARAAHISGPLTMVAAGLVVGNVGKASRISETTQDYLDKFWELIDEIMNAILFLIMGFELLLIPHIMDYWALGLISIGLVLFARFISIWVPTLIIPFKARFDKRTITILVWGGLRGGVSVALALSIDEHLNKNLFLAMTYFIVVFSILVQGLTVSKLTKNQKPSELVEADDLD